MTAACRHPQPPTEGDPVDQFLQTLIDGLLSKNVPAFLRPFVRQLVDTLIARLLEVLREKAGLPAGVMASTSGYSQEQLDAAVAALKADLS